MDLKIERWDKDFSESVGWIEHVRARKTKSTFATFTHSSIRRFLNEVPFSLTTETLFVDLGSGLGHIIFYVYEYLQQKDSSLLSHVHFLGIEYEQRFVDESNRRLRALGYDNCQFLHKDIMTCDTDMFQDFPFVIMFSFDIVFPKPVFLHMKDNLFNKFNRAILWLSSTETKYATPSYEKLYIGPIGVNEGDKNVYFVDGTQKEGHKDHYMKLVAFAEFENILTKTLEETETHYVGQMQRRGKPIIRNAKGQVMAPRYVVEGFLKSDVQPSEMEYFIMYKLEKNMVLINLCINCLKPSDLRCPCHTSYIYCGKQCQREDYPNHYKVHY